MFKICWEKDIGEKVFQYYYDEKTGMIYRINYDEYNKEYKYSNLLKLLPAFSGCFATLVGIVFGGIYLKEGTMYDVIIMALLFIFGVFTHIFYKRSESKLFEYVKSKGENAALTAIELKRYYTYGKKYRCGIAIFIALSIICLSIGALMYSDNRDLISCLMLAVSIFTLVLFADMAAPIKTLRLKNRLKKELKQ